MQPDGAGHGHRLKDARRELLPALSTLRLKGYSGHRLGQHGVGEELRSSVETESRLWLIIAACLLDRCGSTVRYTCITLRRGSAANGQVCRIR